MAAKTLYVGNLPYTTTENDLRELFASFGPVTEVRIIQNKGFGFVDVPEERMQDAIEGTNAKDFGGRTLTVNEAKPRTERSSGFSSNKRSEREW